MEIPVLVQAVPGKGFVATAPAFGWSAEGSTEEAAMQAIQQRVTEGVAGRRLAIIGVHGEANSLLACAGEIQGHPLLDDWRRAVAEYREEIETDPDR